MKKALSVILALCMIFTIMPIAAFATDVNEIDLSGGDINITSDGTYSIVQTGAKPTGYTITVSASSAKITINDVNIVAEGEKAAFTIAPNSSVDLTISGTNSLTGAKYYAGLWVPTGAAVAIQSKDGSAADSLTANGGLGAAGIGGSYEMETGVNGATSGAINIKSGTIIAQGGDGADGENDGGAGIGGGGSGNGGTIIITAENSGTAKITATGGYYSAGIGGGSGNFGNGNGGDITISAKTGGSTTVIAQGGCYGAGIGGGYKASNGKVTISSEEGSSTKVEATGGESGAGIGGGCDYANDGIGKIDILAEVGGSTTVDAIGGYDGAGLGTGGYSYGGGIDINITAKAGGYAEIMAKAGGDASGIGGGYESTGGNIAISSEKDGTTVVTAIGDSCGAGIGSGDAGEGGNITVSAEAGGSTKVDATSGKYGGAGIGGGGSDGSCKKIEIKGSTVIAGGHTAGIGNNADSIDISDSTVTAVSSRGAIPIQPIFNYMNGYKWRTSDASDFTFSDVQTYANMIENTYLEIAPGIAVTAIELDKSTLDMKVGDTDSFIVNFTPENATNKAITWSSSDTNVATVDEIGEITAVGVGTAIITATATGNITATCQVTVAVPVTGVTLDKSALDLTVGDTDTLTATIAPEGATDKTIIWTSSDESVATVDENGKVTAVGAGTAIITATVGGFTATCEITVAEAAAEPDEPVKTKFNFLDFLRKIRIFLERLIHAFSVFSR